VLVRGCDGGAIPAHEQATTAAWLAPTFREQRQLVLCDPELRLAEDQGEQQGQGELKKEVVLMDGMSQVGVTSCPQVHAREKQRHALIHCYNARCTPPQATPTPQIHALFDACRWWPCA
jgi:hypothetical protein